MNKSLAEEIKKHAADAIGKLYSTTVTADEVLVNQTKPEFEGDYTVVLFAFVKKLKLSPDKFGEELGAYLVKEHGDLFTAYNVIKGFLNVSVRDQYFLSFLLQPAQRPKATGEKVMVEYSSPNTNKPLHLGHLRNNFLGWSIAEILKSTGNEVMKSCIVNDRGIHICKSMIAWQLFGNGATPQSTGVKGDHFVGDYYVRCENQIKSEAASIQEKIAAGNYGDFSETDLQKLSTLQKQLSASEGNEKEKIQKIKDEIKDLVRANTPIMKKARQMLVDWEKGDPEVIDTWKMMNSWVYEGFDETYKRIGTDFHKVYYESNTYLLGRDFVEKGIEKDVFYRKEDGSVWIDLTDEGLDEKLVLRKDGTSVYITQDLGLAHQKYQEFPYNRSIYVIADEQNYHMKVLKLILKKLGMPYADGIVHLSYGMVELPSGRMKSREGTVVDADDLVNEMVQVAAGIIREKGKVEGFTEAELKELYDTIALGALKFYLLRVDPKKKMVFNPEESIDFQGFTGSFIQYTHARIKSILRSERPKGLLSVDGSLLKLEKELLLLLEQKDNIIRQAATEYDPSIVANYAYNVAKTYNSFYTNHSVLKAETEEKKQLRLRICELTAAVLKDTMALLGIRVPEKM